MNLTIDFQTCSVVLTGELEEQSLDELGLGDVSEVGLGWGGLVHGLRLVDGDLGLNRLREGQW